MPESRNSRTTDQKLAVFRVCLTGLHHVYGTYDPATGRARQVKQAVSRRPRPPSESFRPGSEL